MIAALTKYKSGRPILAAGPEVQGELDGVISLVTNLSLAIPPRQDDIGSYTGFFKLALKRCEYFCAKEVPDTGSSTGILKFAAPKTRTVFGGEALCAMFEETRAMFENPKAPPVTLHVIRPFRAFAWLLTPDQSREVQRWIASVCLRAEAGCAQANNGAASFCDVLAVASQTGGSSSSSAGPPGGSKSRAQTKAEAKKNEMHASFAKFFAGKHKAGTM